MWLINSSIGRKIVMSVSGLFLVLFLLFHASMNMALLFSDDAYNWICAMLGANWYAVIGSLGIAGIVMLHFVFAFYLTILNRRARGNDRYAVSARQKGVDWNSKNMLILGIIVIGFLVLHLANFWFKMQFAELTGIETSAFDPQDGAAIVKYMFTGIIDGVMVDTCWCHPVYCGLYLIWFMALWFHLTHGIWSALQTIGLSNTVWLKRIKVISTIVATLIVLMFSSVVVYFLGMWAGAL